MLERLIGCADDAAEAEHLARMCASDDPRLAIYCATAAGALCAAYVDLIENPDHLDHLADRADQWTADVAPLRADPRALAAGFGRFLEWRAEGLLEAGANPIWVRGALERCVLFRRAILTRIGKGAAFPIAKVRGEIETAGAVSCEGATGVDEAARRTWPLLGVIIASVNVVGVAPRTSLLWFAFAGAAGGLLAETASAG